MGYTPRDPGKYVAVTPADATPLPGGNTRGVCIAEGGNLAVTYADGDSEILQLPAGTHPITGVAIIAATGTTAVGISAIY